MYYNGQRVPQDYVKAKEYLTKAANQGLGGAYRNLSLMYAQGKGVQKVLKKAEEYIKQGCLHKNEESCDAYAKLQRVKQSD